MALGDHTSLDDVVEVLRAYFAHELPDCRPDELEVRYFDGARQRQLIHPIKAAAPGRRPAGPSAPADDFTPCDFQVRILEALDGKALRTDALGAAVGDRGRLFKPHGLKELQARGWVRHDPKLGFYREDAPPAEI